MKTNLCYFIYDENNNIWEHRNNTKCGNVCILSTTMTKDYVIIGQKKSNKNVNIKISARDAFLE